MCHENVTRYAHTVYEQILTQFDNITKHHENVPKYNYTKKTPEKNLYWLGTQNTTRDLTRREQSFDWCVWRGSFQNQQLYHYVLDARLDVMEIINDSMIIEVVLLEVSLSLRHVVLELFRENGRFNVVEFLLNDVLFVDTLRAPTVLIIDLDPRTLKCWVWVLSCRSKPLYSSIVD